MENRNVNDRKVRRIGKDRSMNLPWIGGEDQVKKVFFLGWKEKRVLGVDWGYGGDGEGGGLDSTILGDGRSYGGYAQCEGKEWTGGVWACWATGTAKTLLLHSGKRVAWLGNLSNPHSCFFYFPRHAPTTSSDAPTGLAGLLSTQPGPICPPLSQMENMLYQQLPPPSHITHP